MRVINWLRRRFTRPAGIGSTADLARFMGERTAFVAQKVLLDHLHGLAGADLRPLDQVPGFQTAMATCRLAAASAVSVEVAELVQVYLRAATTAPSHDQRLAELAVAGLVQSAGRELVLDRTALLSSILERLDRARLAAPRPVHRLGDPAADEIIAHLPITRRLTPLEREVVHNAVRFLLCRVYADLEAVADPIALNAALTRGDVTM